MRPDSTVSPTRAQASTFAAALTLGSLVFASCYGHVESSSGAPAPLTEYEPNDQVWDANDFGFLLPGDALHIHGSLSGVFDCTDGLAFTADVPSTVEFVLHADNPWADVSVWLYDPCCDVFVAEFPACDGFASGTIDFHDWSQQFHLVLVTEWDDADWTLDVFTSHLTGAPEAQGAAAGGSRAAFEERSDAPAPSARARAYRIAAPETETEAEPAPILGAGSIILIDPETGRWSSARVVALADGTVLTGRRVRNELPGPADRAPGER